MRCCPTERIELPDTTPGGGTTAMISLVTQIHPPGELFLLSVSIVVATHLSPASRVVARSRLQSSPKIAVEDCFAELGRKAQANFCLYSAIKPLLFTKFLHFSYRAKYPPSTGSTTPVTIEEAADTKNSAGPTISSGFPTLPRGICDVQVCIRSFDLN